MDKEKLVEVARSYSRKVNMGNYETSDFFCSKKEECYKSESEKVSAELHDFCQAEVEFSINAYKEEHKPVEPPKPAFSKSSRGWESKTDHEEEVGEEKRFNDRKEYGN